MPKLRQAIDGHYYVQQNVFGLGIATFQIKQQGVDFLATKGIYVDDEVPPAYMKRMRDAGFAYTGGSGLGQHGSSKFASNPDFDFEKVNFVLKQSHGYWNLAIHIPELSSDLISNIVAKGLNTRLSVKVNENLVPIVRLWPGKGGATTDIDPTLKAYQFQLVGPWPKSSLPKFPKDFRLRTECERFLVAGQVARRVHWAAPMELEASYVVLTRFPLPERGAPEDLQDVGSESLRRKRWFLYSFSIPETATEELAAWCSRLGFALQERAWKLHLLSPPPTSYSNDGIAVINSASLIIAAKRPESGTKQLELVLQRATDAETSIHELKVKLHGSERTGFVAVRLPGIGRFVIRGTNTWVSPLPIRFDPASSPENSSLRPLRIMVKENCIDGISQASNVIELLVDRSDCPLRIESVVPVTIDCGTRYAEFETADQASNFLQSIWTESYSSRVPAICLISAGNFGFVFCSLLPRSVQLTRPPASSHELRGLVARLQLRGAGQRVAYSRPASQLIHLLVPLSTRMGGRDQQKARLLFRKFGNRYDRTYR